MKENKEIYNIGILSFQDVFNYGGQLQNYALFSLIHQLDKTCRVIDYRCDIGKELFPHYRFSNLKGLVRNIIINPGRIIRKRKFSCFRNKYIKYSQPYNNETIKVCNAIFKKIIVGSDQVWNTDLTNDDYNFFLEFADSSVIKTSYACSFGYNELLGKQKHIAQLLSRFASITVREHSAVSIVRNLINQEPQVALDPTLLLKREDWEAICKKSHKSDYVFVYLVDETEENISIIKSYAKKNGYKIFWAGENWKRVEGIRQHFDIGPDEFVSLIRDAKNIFTGSFHAICFSIIFHKEFFYTLNRDNKNTRITDLFDMLDIRGNTFKEYSTDCPFNIDYKSVDKKLSVYREKSMNLLIEQINLLNNGE